MKRVICVNPKDVQLTLRDTYTVNKEIDTAYKITNDMGKDRFYSKARFTEVME